MKQVVIIGGGAGGFFAAINLKERHPDYQVTILEKSKEVLQKVRISGGGRCNVTHACFDPRELVQHYPRGEKALLGAFSRFQTADTVAWFEERGVPLKTESDGRMFPTTDSSQTIIDCFLRQIKKQRVHVLTRHAVTELMPPEKTEAKWRIRTKNKGDFTADAVVVATGSHTAVWKMLRKLGYRIASPVPSLFTFRIQDKRLEGLAGVSLPQVAAKVQDSRLAEAGALLITHWGLSAPAILRLSAWGAELLHEKNYRFTVRINFIPSHTAQTLEAELKQLKESEHKKQVSSHGQFGIPVRLWKRLVAFAGIGAKQRWAEVSRKHLRQLAESLTQADFAVTGKSTFKEEFVTCGGLLLDEVDMRSMESRKHPNLYFSGEVLNVDAITGGFNFQHAWTSAWIAAQHI